MERSQSLLLVEDEPLVAMSLADALEECGFRVSLCGTGFDALNYIEMEDSITAIVTDIRLGNGPDGWEVARRAREHFPCAKVVYITGDSAAEYSTEGVPKSVILQKPFPTAELVDTVSSLLH
jgi:DNA-binding response OmpR family regulator